MQKIRSYIPMLHRRSFMMFTLQGISFFGLGARLYYLQHLQEKKYKTLSNKNRLKVDIIPPKRGLISDSNGRIIADTKRIFRVEILKETMPKFEKSFNFLKRIVKISPEQSEKILIKAKRSRPYTSILIKENISWREMAKLQVNKNDLFGVNVNLGETRKYLYNNLFSHVVGYVGKISKQDVKDQDDPLQFVPGFEIGKSGLEKSYENYLRGSAGAKQVEVNVSGQIINEIGDIQPTRGQDLEISVDLDLQKFIAKKLSSHRSASMVVMNVQNGDVKAMYSQPSFDANIFVGGISHKDWDKIRTNKYSKLVNKSLAGQYAPGSTFKVIVALTALKHNVVDDKKLFCSGYTEISGRKYHCWKKTGHGKIKLIKSIRESCDVWYYHMSLKVGIDNIAKMSKKFGLGIKYDFEMSPQASGLIPTKKWKQENRNESWYKGDTVISSIGQGFVLTTPLQLAVMTARIATGKEVTPRITKHRSNGELIQNNFPDLGVDKKHLDIIREGMYDVVNHYRGTARNYKTSGWDMAGKTGTSQVRTISLSERESEEGVIKNHNLEWKYRDHALFVAYAPVKNPKYAVSCVVEHGGSGSGVAAPLVRDVLNKLYELENSV